MKLPEGLAQHILDALAEAHESRDNASGYGGDEERRTHSRAAQKFLDAGVAFKAWLEAAAKPAAFNPTDAPIGSVWRHTSGVLYAVFDHLNANEGQEGRPEYPPTIAYINALGRTYARRADDWARSFTRVEVSDDEPVETTLLAAMNHLMDLTIVLSREEV